jgi:hypothetical protein
MEEIAGANGGGGTSRETQAHTNLCRGIRCCHYLGGIGWIWGPSALSRPSACAHVGVYPHPYLGSQPVLVKVSSASADTGLIHHYWWHTNCSIHHHRAVARTRPHRDGERERERERHVTVPNAGAIWVKTLYLCKHTQTRPGDRSMSRGFLDSKLAHTHTNTHTHTHKHTHTHGHAQALARVDTRITP